MVQGNFGAYARSLSPEERKALSQRLIAARKTSIDPDIRKAYADTEVLRNAYLIGRSIKDLAIQYNVNQRTMYRIIRGK